MERRGGAYSSALGQKDRLDGSKALEQSAAIFASQLAALKGTAEPEVGKKAEVKVGTPLATLINQVEAVVKDLYPNKGVTDDEIKTIATVISVNQTGEIKVGASIEHLNNEEVDNIINKVEEKQIVDEANKIIGVIAGGKAKITGDKQQELFIQKFQKALKDIETLTSVDEQKALHYALFVSLIRMEKISLNEAERYRGLFELKGDVLLEILTMHADGAGLANKGVKTEFNVNEFARSLGFSSDADLKKAIKLLDKLASLRYQLTIPGGEHLTSLNENLIKQLNNVDINLGYALGKGEENNRRIINNYNQILKAIREIGDRELAERYGDKIGPLALIAPHRADNNYPQMLKDAAAYLGIEEEVFRGDVTRIFAGGAEGGTPATGIVEQKEKDEAVLALRGVLSEFFAPIKRVIDGARVADSKVMGAVGKPRVMVIYEDAIAAKKISVETINAMAEGIKVKEVEEIKVVVVGNQDNLKELSEKVTVVANIDSSADFNSCDGQFRVITSNEELVAKFGEEKTILLPSLKENEAIVGAFVLVKTIDELVPAENDKLEAVALKMLEILQLEGALDKTEDLAKLANKLVSAKKIEVITLAADKYADFLRASKLLEKA